ncbi:MAG TPA: right-handed parallel beta-helix repeat-containing protein [Luteolibacter sp.]|nr:right-handed parallel beta-helix repeat-containing protein [Luteolibacter sp.]
MKTLTCILMMSGIPPAISAEVVVRNTAELRAALGSIKEGTVLKIAPGEYGGGHYVKGVAKLTIGALDPSNPPVFKGGSEGWHFTRCDDLKLQDLRITGQSSNGLNLDDGMSDTPVKGVTLERIHVGDIGPKGNHDGIKISGLDELTVRDCKVEGWGGEGIDMVGCHRVLVTGCELRGKEGFGGTSGIQMKGGCSEITVEKSRFIKAGLRPLNLGGSTGMPYFRPVGAKYEAKDLTVRDNVIEGGLCAAAFTGVTGATFSGNTILFPEKWIFRILQETTAEGFTTCGENRITGNRIVFRRSAVAVDINIGANTAPATFGFSANQWFAEDQPEKSKPKLPSAEKEGIYGKDPR